MKNLIYTLSIALIFLNGCSQAQDNGQYITTYKYKSTKKNTYYANYDFRANFDLIVNGVVIKRNRQSGVVSGIEYLNPFIAKKGLQTVKMVVKPLGQDSKIRPEDVKDYYIDIVYTEDGAELPLHNLTKLSFPAISQPVDSLVKTWTFSLDVPYELPGLENSQDLRKKDPAALLAEVLDYYKKVHQLINQGNTSAYLQLYKKSLDRQMISMYYGEKQQKEYLQSIFSRISTSKGFMQPLYGYKLYIHPNGKLVSLVTSDNINPALYSSDDQKAIKRYGLDLHLPNGSDKLEVF